ncbi:hypothetical protein [Corallococcus macrosporus]|uniref:Cell envelope biogenesis protein TolA n=1 Tax=Myxococcus fulvus (strain ATCC BAA-855 / HW-1) TaxID=483219 RepID=F8CCF3_MYXFH|nr:hypothetical protein [Corallococcus macrosporus]AEI68487.1 hypothetical protein LILAB_33030 [Corallococcus macrosporus]
MLVLVLALAVGLAISLYFNLFAGPKHAALPSSAASSSPRAELVTDTQARAKAEAELQRKQKELDEQRSQLQDVKEQLKQAKRKLYEQKESDKGAQELAKARAEVERSASTQLERTREELSHALVENQRLKSELESKGRRPQPAPAPTAAPAQEGEAVVAAVVPVVPTATEAAPQERRQRVYRELNDADREKMERLEQAATKDRNRAAELEKELRRVKGRNETQQRVYAATKHDLDLSRDKYKALEKRLNRTLLERDLLRRAIKDLEKKTGMLADRTELTPEEVAASDQRTEETSRVRAEDEGQATKAEAPAGTEQQAPESAPADAETKPAQA